MRKGKELTFLDSERTRKRIRIAFFGFLAVLLILDFFVHKHGHFSWETAPAFFAVYGFVAYVVLIALAKLLRRVVKRKEDYYD